MPDPSFTPQHAQLVIDSLRNHLAARVFGRETDGQGDECSTLDLVLCALLADGHVLLEDFPGSGKSYLCEQIGTAMISDVPPRADGVAIHRYRRIQCTPDLLPGDITGFSLYQKETGKLVFQPGPVFGHVLLVDEINRTTPKVQSALLEAMAERRVTIDGESHALGDVFFVIATQNPLDQAGTYPLPAASLDRFLFKRRLGPLAAEHEARIMLDESPASHANWRQQRGLPASTEPPKQEAQVALSHLALAQAVICEHVTVRVDTIDVLLNLGVIIDQLVHGSLPPPHPAKSLLLKPGSRPSPRALKWLVRALKVLALMRGQTQVTPQHVPCLAVDFLRHRLIPARQIEDEELSACIRALAVEACARVQHS